MDPCRTCHPDCALIYFSAPGEAEAQCAELVKAGKCWGAATEDSDAFAFGCPRLIRYAGGWIVGSGEKVGSKSLPSNPSIVILFHRWCGSNPLEKNSACDTI